MKRFLHILTVLALVSCTNKMEFVMESLPDQLLLTAQLKSSESTHAVYAAVGNNHTVKPAPELEMVCTVGGKDITLTREVVSKEDGLLREPWRKYTFDGALAPGDVVRISARTADGQFSATTESTIPPLPTLSKVDTVTVRTKNLWQPKVESKHLRFKVSVDDPKGENWYMLNVLARYDITMHAEGHPDKEISDTRSPKIDSGDDPILSEGVVISNEELFGTLSTNAFHIFSDTLFEGAVGEASFKIDYNDIFNTQFLNIPPAESNPDGSTKYMYDGLTLAATLDVNLYGLPLEEYNYLKAIGIRASGFFFSDFMEPIAIPDNVEGADGFIGVMSCEKISIKLPIREITFGNDDSGNPSSDPNPFKI